MDWYVGAINNSVQRTVTIPLTFLSPGKYHAEIYKEAPDAVNNPNKLVKETAEVSATDKLIVDLPPGGGYVLRLRPN
jgi:alpha-glucosidase